MDEITRGTVLGENYYIAVGAGTGGVGTGDPTASVYTQLLAATQTFPPRPALRSRPRCSGRSQSSSPAALGILQRAAGSIRRRSWTDDVWTSIGQGLDTAGFWVSRTGGPTGFTRTASGGLGFWGVPVFYDANLGANPPRRSPSAASGTC